MLNSHRTYAKKPGFSEKSQILNEVSTKKPGFSPLVGKF